MTDQEIRDAAMAAGWEVSAASLYDEEGIEGWRWTSPTGCDYCEIGGWHEPPAIPDRLRELFDHP
jgi:hypothetical protein